MPKKVKPPPTGIWKHMHRLQRVGFGRGISGAGGGWLALGIGAWGLQHVRKIAARNIEVLINEPLRPGERLVITNQTTTRAEYDKARKAERRQQKALARDARRSGGRRSRADRAPADASGRD